jgi:hypothetical protein
LDDQRIIVFCDLTQSFSFENSTSPREIAEAINAKFPYTLTINLRSPRTVFERILEVKSTEYQQFCPRPLELDTLTEIAVEDMGSTLEQVVHQLLHEESIPAQSIVLIDATLGSRKEEEYLGIQVVSAAKFRGLEALVVIIWAGSGSNEISLFCAYTRATSTAWRKSLSHLSSQGLALISPFERLCHRAVKVIDKLQDAGFELSLTCKA